MDERTEKVLYRIFCFISLGVALYLVADLWVTKTLDIKTLCLFLLFIVIVIWGTIDWVKYQNVVKKQERELTLYHLYSKPLDDMVKEIRSRQHEFDNHMNAILNMHLTIDNYEELVERQSAYIKELYSGEDKTLLSLLKLSDRVMAGFLYSKLSPLPDYIKLDLEIREFFILSSVSESILIEIMGILIDNAVQACTRERNQIRMILDSKEDRLLFEISNQAEPESIGELSRFFEKGYSTKSSDGRRGLGLYRARNLIKKVGGKLEVSVDTSQGTPELTFRAEL